MCSFAGNKNNQKNYKRTFFYFFIVIYGGTITFINFYDELSKKKSLIQFLLRYQIYC